MTRSFVYVSAASAGVIDCFELDHATGQLSPLQSSPAGAMVMPMAVSPDGRHLYAAIRSEPHHLKTFAIDATTGQLRIIAETPLPASMPYVTTALQGRLLLTASYGSNCAAALALDVDGCARSPAHQVVPTGKHAHSIITDRTGRFVFVPCLGSDQVLQFSLDGTAGMLSPHRRASIDAPAGFGPRHAVMASDNRTLFVLGEFTAEIACYRFDEKQGGLEFAGVTATAAAELGLRPGTVRGVGEPMDRTKHLWGGDIKITPDGRFLYATERNSSTIALMAWDTTTQSLKRLAAFPTEKQPRGIGMDVTGTFLVASGELSDHIASYRIDERTGMLIPASRAPVASGANWVEIVTPA